MHVASLTNNVWLCQFLLERGANVNAIMKNKGKYYSPYDAALIKGHSEAKDFLFQKGGRPGSHVTGHAARTIQVRYRYHRNRGRPRRRREKDEREDKKEEEERVEEKHLELREEDEDKSEGHDGKEEREKEEEEKCDEHQGRGEAVESEHQGVVASVTSAPDEQNNEQEVTGKSGQENKENVKGSKGKGKSTKSAAASEEKEPPAQHPETGKGSGKKSKSQAQKEDVTQQTSPPTVQASPLSEKRLGRPKSGKTVPAARSPRRSRASSSSSSSSSPSPSPARSKRASPGSSPKYVEKGTQITTGATEVCINGEKLDKPPSPAGAKREKRQSRSPKDVGGVNQSEKHAASKKTSPSLETEKKEQKKHPSSAHTGQSVKSRKHLTESASAPAASSQDDIKNISKEKLQKSSTQQSKERAPSSKQQHPADVTSAREPHQPVPLPASSVITQRKSPRISRTDTDDSSQHLECPKPPRKGRRSPKPKTPLQNSHHKSRADYSDDFESEKSYRSSSSSSSHGASSDIESSSCERVKKSHARTSETKHSVKQTSKSSSSPTRSGGKVEVEESSETSQKEHRPAPDSKHSDRHSKRDPVSSTHTSKQTSKLSKLQSAADTADARKKKEQGPKSSIRQQTTTAPKQQGSVEKANAEIKTTPREAAEENDTMGSRNSKLKTCGRNGHISSSDDGSGSESEREDHATKKPDDDQAYTDLEEMAEAEPSGQNEAITSPRKRKTRPNKLIQAIQESVKRYERERQSIRQLHQIRRAQIYSGPTWDVALFRKIVEQHGKPPPSQNGGNQGDGTPHSASTTNAVSWEEYLQEQLKIIQEDRKSASSARKINSAHPQGHDNSDNAANAASKQTPRNNFRRPGETGSLDGRNRRLAADERAGGKGTNNLSSSSKTNENKTSTNTAYNNNNNSTTTNMNHNNSNNSNNNNMNNNDHVGNANVNKKHFGPPLRRAQTARVVRTAPSGENHQETTTAPLDMSQWDDPRKFTSREAIRQRQELAQQQLIKAYRPLGGMELFRGNTYGGPPSRGGARPLSTMSSRTSASGGSWANGRPGCQSRGSSRESNYSTIMTAYGTRRIRTPGPQGEANPSQPLHSRPRHPLIFKEPEEYDKSRQRAVHEQQGER